MRYFIALATLSVAVACWSHAQDVEGSDATENQEQAEATADQPQELDPKDYVRFEPLTQVITTQGNCTAQVADTLAQPVKLNRAYPLKTLFSTGPDSLVELRLSDRISLRILARSRVLIDEAPELPRARRIRLLAGSIEVNTPEDLKDLEAMGVDCYEISARQMCGRTAFEVKSATSVDSTILVRGITGRCKIIGPHYVVPSIRAANQLQVAHALNHSYTRLESLAGDYAVELANGTAEPTAFPLSPKAMVKMWRKNNQTTGHIAVTVLTIQPSGRIKNSFSHVAEGTASETLSKGELVKDTNPPTFVFDSEAKESIRTGEEIREVQSTTEEVTPEAPSK